MNVPTYRVVSMLCQNVCEQFWHPVLDCEGETVDQGTNTQDSGMPLTQSCIVIRILSSWDGSAVKQPQEPILYIDLSTWGHNSQRPLLVSPTHLQVKDTPPRR